MDWSSWAGHVHTARCRLSSRSSTTPFSAAHLVCLEQEALTAVSSSHGGPSLRVAGAAEPQQRLDQLGHPRGAGLRVRRASPARPGPVTAPERRMSVR